MICKNVCLMWKWKVSDTRVPGTIVREALLLLNANPMHEGPKR